jgi:predicted dinucleotide-binding enzyme
MNPRFMIVLITVCASIGCSQSDQSAESVILPHKETIAIIGTGDMGNSLGPKLAEVGYQVIYGSRDPTRESVRKLVKQTGPDASATTQIEAAQAASIVLLAVSWPPLKQVAQNLGNLDGKVVIDIAAPIQQAEDGYPENMVEPSTAELIQGWNPGAKVVKWFLPTAQYIDKPLQLGNRPANFIAADDQVAKEIVAQMAALIGQDPVDAGPLRFSREIEAMWRLFFVPLYQQRDEGFEFFIRRTSFWPCNWGKDWTEPVADSDDLAQFPKPETALVPCSKQPTRY